jgi:hypothetical protein
MSGGTSRGVEDVDGNIKVQRPLLDVARECFGVLTSDSSSGLSLKTVVDSCHQIMGTTPEEDSVVEQLRSMARQLGVPLELSHSETVKEAGVNETPPHSILPEKVSEVSEFIQSLTSH